MADRRGIQKEIGQDLIDLKKPLFNNDTDFTLRVFERNFDYLIAQSIFSHATQAQIHRCLDQATKVMTPSSLFVANFMEGSDNYTGDQWVYPGCSEFTMDFMIRAGRIAWTGVQAADLAAPDRSLVDRDPSP